MSMNYKEVAQGLPEEEFAKYATGVNLVNAFVDNAFVDSLQKHKLLPKRFAKPVEVLSSQPESVEITEPLTFSNQEREVLLGDGAVLYLLTGETIRDQQQAGRPFWYVVDGGERLLDFPALRIEVVIYPDPEKFFVPESFNKTITQQDNLMEQDTLNLRKRLGLEGITMVRPEASEVTEVVFKHFKETQVRLFGENYKEQASGYYPYTRTSTPTNKSGSYLAGIGFFSAVGGLRVSGWHLDHRYARLGLVRWVVPQRSG